MSKPKKSFLYVVNYYSQNAAELYMGILTYAVNF